MQTRPKSFKNERDNSRHLYWRWKSLLSWDAFFSDFTMSLPAPLFAFPFIRFRKMPNLMHKCKIPFDVLSAVNKSISWIAINIGTRCDIKSLSYRLKITKNRCVWLRAIFHEEYAWGYANVRCSADLWFMHRQNEYAKISEPKMKMVARRGRKIAADASTTWWESINR